MSVAILNGTPTMVKVSELKNHPDNPRRGSVQNIVESLKVNGWWGFLVVQTATNHVLIGNHRLKAALVLKMKEVPVVYVNVDDEQAKRMLVADNRMSDLGEYDEFALFQMLQELENTQVGLDGLGYDEAFMAELMAMWGDQGTDGEGSGSAGDKPAREKVSRTSVDWKTFKVFHVAFLDDCFVVPLLHYLISFNEIVRENFRLSFNFPKPTGSTLFLDSGILGLAKTEGRASLKRQRELIQLVRDNPNVFDYAAMMDVPMYPEILKKLKLTREKALQITLENAAQFAEADFEGTRRVMIVHGDPTTDSLEPLIESCERMAPYIEDEDVVALGALRMASDDICINSVKEVVKRFPNNDLHLFGVTRPVAAFCAVEGLTSVDSSSAFTMGSGHGKWCWCRHIDGRWMAQKEALSDSWLEGINAELDKDLSLAGPLRHALQFFSAAQIELALRLQIRDLLEARKGEQSNGNSL